MKHQIKVLSAILILVVAALACGLPSISDIPSIPGLPDADGPVFQDNFDGFDQPWGIGTDADSSVEYADGGLQFKVFTTEYFVWSSASDTTYSNIHVEVTAKNNSTDGNAVFGIICNQGVIDDNLYYFAVTPNGEYAIAKGALAQDDLFLTNDDLWAASDLITPNAASYRIGADCGNGTLTLYVDGKQIASVQDATYPDGKVALFAWSAEIENSVDVTFDDFVITNLK